MRSAADFLADIEADRESREAEIRLIDRLHSSTELEIDKQRLRRLLVVITYAHLEGFCRFVLSAYVGYINSKSIVFGDATPAIAAAGMHKLFYALRDPQSKHPLLKVDLPNDSYLHLKAREQKFIAGHDEIRALRIMIPDEVVDTESNVDTKVLKKLFFQLGLDFNAIEVHRGKLNELVGVRNAIAHGDRLKHPSGDDVRLYLDTARSIMSFVQDQVFDAMQNSKFLNFAGEQQPTTGEQGDATSNGHA